VDALTPKRFEPLAAVGQVRLAEEVWRGGFDLEGTGKAAPAALGRLTLTHDGRSGAGGLQISVPPVTFVEGGLQPAMLTPLVADLVQSPATGSVAFEGRFDWTKTAEPTSSGRLSVPGLDFVSPAGAVKGVKGDIVFTSLTPLITAPDQKLTVDSLAVGTEATDLDLTFAVDAAGIKISAGSVQAGGGVVSVEPFVVPLDAAQPYDGVVVLDTTPFYAESGGQVGDEGLLLAGSARFDVGDTQKIKADVFGHHGTVTQGTLNVGDQVTALVNLETRAATERNHSVTHLMHKALREVLGSHVQQKGSLVNAERTRFDFAHNAPVTEAQIRAIEAQVNAEILDNEATQARLMDIESAQKTGAMMLFGEKYGETVRVLDI